MKHVQSPTQSWVSDRHLEDSGRVATLSITPNVRKIIFKTAPSVALKLGTNCLLSI